MLLLLRIVLSMDLLKKNRFGFIFVFWSLFFSPSILAQTQISPDSIQCTIELQCQFSGLEVLFDNSKIGRTPIPILHVNPGVHRIRVRHPDPSGWLNRDWEREVILKKAEKKTLVVKFPDTYWVDSDPPGASVFFMDSELGKTPMVVKIPSGEDGFLVLKKTGYSDCQIKLNFPSSSLVHVSLKKIEMFSDMKSSSHKLKKSWIIGSGAAALFSGVAGYCFKAMANRAYGKYMAATTPESMNYHFNNTIKFDKISTGFYVAAEVSLVFSLFLFIKGM